MNSDDDPVSISRKLFAMLDKVNDNTEYQKYLDKIVIKGKSKHYNLKRR
jgi:hypothetical protein